MKRNKIIITLFTGMTLLSACHDLNLNPLSYGSTESWYSDETEVEMAGSSQRHLYRNRTRRRRHRSVVHRRHAAADGPFPQCRPGSRQKRV